MEENFDALEVIARTRGKVKMDSAPTGNYLFPMWGWITAFFYLLEFILIHCLRQDWKIWTWLWVGIPIIGVPLMTLIVKKDHERSHMRSLQLRLVLNYWIFAACAIGVGGFVFGFADLYRSVENPLICLLVGMGSFITGEEVRYRPMVAGGLAGAAIGIGAFVLQGDLWTWQTLCVALTAVVSLIIPGHMFEKSVRNGI